jgi:hypothetical protein
MRCEACRRWEAIRIAVWRLSWHRIYLPARPPCIRCLSLMYERARSET